ncbi:MAG: hypothetical protein WCB92_21895 [Mycobacterium sp.]
MTRKSSLQVFDQPVENSPFLFVNVNLAPQATDLCEVATRFGGGDHPAVFSNPLVNLLATLDQQIQVIHGLAVVGRHRGHGRVLTHVGRSRAALGDGLRKLRPLGVMKSSVAPIRVGRGVWVARAIVGGRTGQDHFVSPNWILGLARKR